MPVCPKCHHSWGFKLRSNQQNRYLHGVFLKILSDELGYTLDEVKGIMKWAINKKYGMDLPHTSNATTKELEDWLARGREWASIELGIYIPEPNEQEVCAN
jgi:hypothetical protein